MRTRLAVAGGVVAIVAAFIALAFVFAPSGDERPLNFSSDVMLPTISFDERLRLDEGAYDDGAPEAGQVVAFTPPTGAFSNRCGARFRRGAGCDTPTPQPKGRLAESEFVMRIVAGPGDEVAIEGGRAVVNGEPLGEDYVKPCPGELGCELPTAVTVPDGHFYVLGDNRAAAKDSRYWGPLPAEAILGRIELDQPAARG